MTGDCFYLYNVSHPTNIGTTSGTTTNPHFFFYLKSGLKESERNSNCMFYVRVDWYVQCVRPQHIDFISFNAMPKSSNLILVHDQFRHQIDYVVPLNIDCIFFIIRYYTIIFRKKYNFLLVPI
jgi:hypothetical protein